MDDLYYGRGDLPDIVLMDINLAGKMNGIEATRIMKEKYEFALVFLTGMNQMDIFEQEFDPPRDPDQTF